MIRQRIGAFVLIVGFVGLLGANAPQGFAQIGLGGPWFDLPNSACFIAAPGSSTRTAQCTGFPVACHLVTHQCQFAGGTIIATRGTSTETTYEYCTNTAAGTRCEVDWTNSECLNTKWYGAAGCTVLFCEESRMMDDCHTEF